MGYRERLGPRLTLGLVGRLRDLLHQGSYKLGVSSRKRGINTILFLRTTSKFNNIIALYRHVSWHESGN